MHLNAGPVKVLYENGFLRYLTIGGQEVVRMIYFAVRDQDWSILPGTITDERIDRSKEHFAISYVCTFASGDIKIKWDVVILGLSDGTLSFSIDGLAQTSFLKNRIGFCVLHPLEGLAGKPCFIHHPDGSSSTHQFPELISPDQPFKNIKSMQWPVGEKGRVQLNFEGEIFETEDQRNWTDDSYKTYCTPLDLPFPVWVQEGEVFKQKITFSIVHLASLPKTYAPEAVSLYQKGAVVSFPAVGIGLHAEGIEPQQEEILFLKSVEFNHLRADVFLNSPGWENQLLKACAQSASLGIPLELALFFGENPKEELSGLLDLFLQKPCKIKLIAIFEAAFRRTTDRLFHTVAPAIRSLLPFTQVGGGADANYAEFNRNRISFKELDFTVYALNPQVHATDNLTLTENLAAQAHTVKSAQHLTNNKAIHISSVTLKPRFNAVAASSSQSKNVPPADIRQSTSFASAWTLGSLKYVAEAGAAAVTYYETTGTRGICSGKKVYPVGYLLRMILQFKPVSILPVQCNFPLKVSALLLQRTDKKLLLLANHTSKEQKVLLPGNFAAQTFATINSKGYRSDAIPHKDECFVWLLPDEVLVIAGR